MEQLESEKLNSNTGNGVYTLTLTPSQQAAVDGALTMLNRGEGVYKIGGYAGTGKSQPLRSIIQTPFGPMKMGNILPGMLVFGVNGQPTKVTGIYPQGKKITYKVCFRDKTFALASEDHLWAVTTPKMKQKNKPPRIMTTGEMLKEGITFESGPYKYYIPLCRPVQYPEKELPIPPYTLGVAIGDGALCGNGFSLVLSDPQIADRIRKENPYYVLTERKKPGCVWYNITYPYGWKENPLKQSIRGLGLNVLSRNKFIPIGYLYCSSIQDRWDLLRGLMDTDGTSRGNKISFSTVSPRLADDICTLVQSLGGTAIKSEYDRGEKGIEYSVNVKTFENPFYIESKAKNWKLSWKNPPSRVITNIEMVDVEEHQCISVEAEDGLYLTDNYIVTHNTTLARAIFETVPGCMPCSLTGKAACRLRQKGISEARTIHRTIYNVDPYTWFCRKKPAAELDGSWFLIDEASMISEKIWRDICSYEKPIILIGDPGQLEPIGGDPELMHHPDVTLTEIHRQAADNGIIQFATDTRRGRPWQEGYPDVTLMRGGKLSPQDMLEADIILCGFNNTRIKCNRRIRELKKYPKDELIVPGERIIVLRNNYVHEVFNGQILAVSEVLTQDLMTCTVKATDEEGASLELPLIREQFDYPGLLELDSEETEREWVYADYGYCITTHKAQGSEWDKVIVMNQIAGSWEAKRWQYTAITRAAEKLMYWIN
jgi:hypothetical protein